jgi:hypothetical protein
MKRSGRKGNYLMASDYSGITRFSSDLRKDWWGQYGEPELLLKRNLQEIATPLEDPAPVPIFRGGQYEYMNPCASEVAPPYVGLTNVPTNPDNMAFQVLDLNPAIPDMEVGCTFVVR